MNSEAKQLCTNEEIAEKKRIAQERLKQKIQKQKEQKMMKQQNVNKTEIRLPLQSKIVTSNSDTLTAEQKNEIERKRLEAIQRAKEKKLISAKKAEALAAIKSGNPASTANRSTFAHRIDKLTGEISSRNVPYQRKLAVVDDKPSIPIICTMDMISEDRFSANLLSYNETVIKEFKKIESKAYIQSTKRWTFKIDDYKKLSDALGAMKDYVSLVSIPEFVIKLLKQETVIVPEQLLDSIEPTLLDSLFPFQREGVLFGISRGGRFLLGDDMGLGKTRQALAVADFYKDDWPLLIVTTAQCRPMWLDQINDLLPNISPQDICILESHNDYISDARVVVCSYTSLEINMKKIETKRFRTILFDESQNIKNPKAKQTINASKLGLQAARVVLISGTPALSRPAELFSQLAIIDKSFSDYMSFTKRYCMGHQTKFGWNASGSSNLEELNIVLRKKFMIRRMKNDVSNLGKKSRVSVELKDLKLTNDESQDMQVFAQNYQKAANGNKSRQHEILIEWYNKTAKLKAGGVCRYIENKMKNDKEKFLIFAAHHCVMDALSTCLFQNGFRFVRIDGSTKSDIRHSAVSSFQNDPEIRCAILSIRACCSGITMTAASEVIFAELDWTPNAIIQAEGRAHRIGQDRQVTCYFLLASNTVDDVLWPMLIEKQRNLSKVGLVGVNEHLSQAVSTTTFSAGPSMSKNSIKEHLQRKSEEKNDVKEKLSESKASSQSFYTCPDFDDMDLALLDAANSIENKPAEENLDGLVFDDDEIMPNEENLDDFLLNDVIF